MNENPSFLFVRFVFFLLLGHSRRILIRHLALDTDKVGHFTIGIAQGRNEELIPEGSSIDTVVEQAHGHVVSLFDGLADTFDVFGVGFGSLQETAIASQDLIQTVPGQVEETLRSIHNRIVWKRWVRDHKVLLRRLQRLDEGEVWVIQNLVGNTLARGEQSVDIVTGRFGLLVEQRGCLGISQVRADRPTELFVLLLEEGNGLLQRFQQELLADARALGMFTIAFTIDGNLNNDKDLVNDMMRTPIAVGHLQKVINIRSHHERTDARPFAVPTSYGQHSSPQRYASSWEPHTANGDQLEGEP
jgi:hypothetical protein